MTAEAESRRVEVDEVSRGLKAVAKELNVPIVALSQLSRAVETRTSKEPVLSDLRESGGLEQDADVVVFLYRDEYYNADSEHKGSCKVNVAKQRNGKTGPFYLHWIPETCMFRSVTKE
jgi:replicative DNA helicase